MAAAFLWAWNSAAGDWVKLAVDASGHLQVDISNLPTEYPLPAAQVTDLKAITSYPDPVISQSTPESLKHIPHGSDYEALPTYYPMKTDSKGRIHMIIHFTTLDALDDVSVPTPLDWQILYWNATDGKWEASYNWLIAHTVAIEFIIDGGGSAITTGQKGHLEIPFACTITGWTILADQSGSIVVDVWKDTYANFPPTVADTIAGSEKPTLATAQKNQDLTLTTWTIAITAGDILAFNVDSVATVTRVTIALRVTR